MRYGALRIAIIYVIISLLWITFSDRFLVYLLTDANSHLILVVSTFKGYFFVVINGFLLYIIIKRDDRMLKRNEGQYRSMYEANPTPMWIYDIESLNIVSVNDAAVAAYGYTREEFLKKNIRDIRPDDDREKVIGEATVLSAGIKNNGTWRHVKRNGEIIYVNITSHKIQFNNKSNVLVMARDMTEHILHEQSLDKINHDLEAEKRKLSETQLISKVAGWEFYPETNKLVWSDELYQLTGINKDDTREIFDIYVEHIFPEDREMMLAGLKDLITQGKTLDVIHRITSLDGSVRFMRQLARLEQTIPVIKVVGSMQDVTELKLLEQERNKYLYNFEDTLNSISDAFFALDNGMKIIRINNAFKKITNQHTAELIGESIFNVFPKDKNNFYSYYEKALKERVIVKREDYSEVLNKWIRMAAFPTDDGVSVYFSDISEDKLKDIKLKEAIERYELVAQATKDVIYDLDIINDKLIYNTSLTQLVNVPVEQVGYNLEWWRSLIHPDDVQEVAASQEKIKRQRKTNWECEYRIHCGEGNYKYIMDQGYFVFNDKHEPVRLIGAIRDIDALKRSIQENKRLADIITRVNNMVIVTNELNQITWVNKAFEEVTGYVLAELAGHTPMEFLTGPVTDKSLLNNIAQRKAFTADAVIHTRKIQSLWVSAEFTPLYNDDEVYTGYIAVYQNITSRKEKEVEIQRQNNFLRDLAWMSSHEMRRPVATMLGLVNLLEIAETDNEKNEVIPLLGKSVNEMDRIVHEIHIKISAALHDEQSDDQQQKTDQ